jgi:arsenate reductase (glutaredoxin)
MNIQIFGKAKCFETKKAERYFKERSIKYQFIDIMKYGMSEGEFRNVLGAVGFEKLFDEKAKGAETIKYLAFRGDMELKLLEDQSLIRTPVVRNGRKATVGYCPDIWKDWE